LERLLRETVQWDITVAVVRDGGELRFSPCWGFEDSAVNRRGEPIEP
jgi:hypothetical protein